MSTPTTITALESGGAAFISRLIAILDYALNDKESDHLMLEVNMHGCAWQTDERGDLDDEENPGGMFNEKYLGDLVKLDGEEFSTTDERCSFGVDPISREDLQELRRILAARLL